MPSKSRRQRAPAWLRDFLSIAVTLLVLLVARASLADHYVVPSGSMQPTVHVGDRIFVNKAAFGVRVPLSDVWLGGQKLPARGTVVVLDSPDDGPVLLKRVVAHPGDVVSVRGGRLILNGREVKLTRVGGQKLELLGHPHPISLEHGGGPDFGPRRVPAGHLLVLGDNRGNSRDGRSFGFVKLEKLRGEALGIYARDGRPGWWRL